MNTELMRAILDCGEDDLHILDDCNVDLFSVIDTLKMEGIFPTMANIACEIFERGKEHAVEVHACAVAEEQKAADEGDEEAKQRLEDLSKLNPASDVTWDFNMASTYLYMKNKSEYERLLPGLIDSMEEIMGWELMEVVF